MLAALTIATIARRASGTRSQASMTAVRLRGSLKRALSLRDSIEDALCKALCGCGVCANRRPRFLKTGPGSSIGHASKRRSRNPRFESEMFANAIQITPNCAGGRQRARPASDRSRGILLSAAAWRWQHVFLLVSFFFCLLLRGGTSCSNSRIAVHTEALTAALAVAFGRSEAATDSPITDRNEWIL